jgi:putative iron-regulated protein
MRSKRWLPSVVVVVLAIATIAGCGGDDEPAVSEQRKAAVAERYADIVHDSYGRAIQSTLKMQAAIERFLDSPTQAGLAEARKAWLDARDDYIVTEPFRFYGGPIDDPRTGPEGLINAWPMDEAYVDYVSGQPRAGIINDRAAYPTITADVIVEANEKGGETNISSGWHAIEFLLWGQDRSPTGPGARPASDYTTAPNAARRATYLRLTTQRLLTDLRSVQEPWAPRGGAYRKAFLADPDKALTNILRGVGTLNSHELAGERMAVALDSKEQEDEHSCFSDNTNADVVNDLKGIRMVYMGAADGGGGADGLDALVREVDPDLARALRARTAATVAAAGRYPATFERMIAAPVGSAEHKALADSIASIEAQGTELAKAAKALDVKVNFEG